MAIFAYIRVSSVKQENNSSLEHQKACIEAYCASRNLTLDPNNIFTEVESGAKQERTEFNKMREAMKNTKLEHLLVYSIDRLTRSVYVGEIIAKEVRELGGSIISVTQGFDDRTPSGRMTRQMLTVVAEMERETILQRTSSGRKATVKKGLWGGGRPPMGYKTVGSDGIRGYGKLSVDEKEAQAVNLMFSLRKQGRSYREIAGDLEDKKIFTSKNTPYNPGTIKRIIDNQQFYQGKSVSEDDGVALPQHPAILEES
jgi:site-specific DNA recombinase